VLGRRGGLGGGAGITGVRQATAVRAITLRWGQRKGHGQLATDLLAHRQEHQGRNKRTVGRLLQQEGLHDEFFRRRLRHGVRRRHLRLARRLAQRSPHGVFRLWRLFRTRETSVGALVDEQKREDRRGERAVAAVVGSFVAALRLLRRRSRLELAREFDALLCVIVDQVCSQPLGAAEATTAQRTHDVEVREVAVVEVGTVLRLES
jgi:hypothetical protein